MTRIASYLPRAERDASTFDNTFQSLGVPITAPTILVKVINNSDTDIDVSTDGATDHDFVASKSFFLYDMRANHGISDEYAFPTSTQFTIRGALAGIGNVYLVVIKEGS